jgi:hypothetical protein
LCERFLDRQNLLGKGFTCSAALHYKYSAFPKFFSKKNYRAARAIRAIAIGYPRPAALK